MNRTEYIGKLNALYVGEKNCLEELITIYDEKDKEIERLNKEIEEYQKALDETTSEKIDLENIIKEVREYMNKHEIEEVYLDCKLYETKVYKDILEILDKGSDNNG